MDASMNPTSTQQPPAPSTADPTAPTSEGDAAKEKKLNKKAGKGGSGKRGAVKLSKGEKKPRKSEEELLKGISKPATRRLFKQIYKADQLRLAEDAVNAIRATIGVTTRRITRAMVEGVLAAKRQTAYLVDSRDAVQKEIPQSTVFVH